MNAFLGRFLSFFFAATAAVSAVSYREAGRPYLGATMTILFCLLAAWRWPTSVPLSSGQRDGWP